MTKVPMTAHGAERLREELNHLKTVERPNVIKAIAEARAHGDLKENAEYHAAREQQGFIEGRIADIEAKLANCHIIDIQAMPRTGNVVFGVTVTIINCDTEETLSYQIVGDDEADIKSAKISINSPIARALIGKKEGDEVNVKTPAGEVLYEVATVEYI